MRPDYYYKAIGSITGCLDFENKKLIASKDKFVLPIDFNFKFSTYLDSLSLDDKRVLEIEAFSYPALPKTHSEEPFLKYTLIGIDRETDDTTDTVYINGKCVYENTNYAFSLFEVQKQNAGHFVIKVFGDLPTPKNSLHRYFALITEREEDKLVLRYAKVLPSLGVRQGYRRDTVDSEVLEVSL
jgi:hypothetical protein